MQLTEIFIELCAQEFFYGTNKQGIPHYERYTFEQFLTEKIREVERAFC